MTQRNVLFKSYLGLSFLGIVVAIYHAYTELTSFFTYCNLNSHVSCGLLFQSGYTTIAVGSVAVPFWFLGIVWFPLTSILGFLLWNSMRLLLVPILLIGDIFTIYLWYIELGIVDVICPVCVSLYVMNYVMTGLAAWSSAR
ncbi:MAG: vitamin K epoxide reductase family protein [Nitrososphaerales archaeon]